MRQIKFTILLFVVTIIGTGLHAQQEPQFTQNMFNRVFTNPAFAGIGEGICVTGLIRQQWSGFKDSEGEKV
ncbi:MAG: type IX secretion system membrane protein PorP/SprF, partial [Bacteroidales bacterium]|nr:type IX secretion system membrane protein PorP/SprF [Bacteroidales bacterium]